MRGADGAAVPIAGDDEHVQVRAAGADAAGDGEGAAVEAVEPVGGHIVREAAGAADAGDADGFFRGQLFIACQTLYGVENGVIATAGAPAGGGALVVFNGAGAGGGLGFPLFV